MKYALVALAALLLGLFAAQNVEVFTETFSPKETLVAQISLTGVENKIAEKENSPPVEFCSFGGSAASSARLAPLVFSEIAWMGDAESSNNEWIELKNVSDEARNISGWQILDKDKQIKIVLSGEIGSGEFLPLRRGEDYEGNLRNSDEGLRLFDKECNLIDEVNALPAWPAGDNKNKIPMKRAADLWWYTPGGEISEVESPKIETAAGKININTAGPEELQKITGVGPVISQRIIEYREANGFFREIEDLKEVKGIGEKTFEKMRDEISL